MNTIEYQVDPPLLERLIPYPRIIPKSCVSSIFNNERNVRQNLIFNTHESSPKVRVIWF
jgi:hypothetical protein